MEAIEALAACAAIKKNYPALHKAVTVGDIPMILYSEEFIEENTWEKFTDIRTPLTEAEKGNAILRDVKKMVQIYPSHFELFCKILSREKMAENVASTLHVAFEEHLAQQKKTEMQIKQNENKEFDDLKEELGTYKKASRRPDPPTGLKDCIERAIRYYIETAVESGCTKETLNHQMQSLCDKELLISSDTCKWALQQVINISNQKPAGAKRMQLAALTSPAEIAPPPSLCPNTLYHASLCSRAVNSCSKTREVHGFLNRNGHKLQEASLSPQTETVDQYLIAKNGNTIYVAFRSKSTLTQWTTKHSSFEEGLEEQTQKIPLRFFTEQILKQQRIVFTGFSFGGMLACCVTANLWREPTSSLNTALLKRNVTCITFGQPLVSIPYVQETIQSFPQLEETIHLVQDKEDTVPRLLYYYGFGCRKKAVSLAQSLTKSTASMSVKSGKLITDFEGPFSAKFLSALANLQNHQARQGSYSRALQSTDKQKPTVAESLKVVKGALRALIVASGDIFPDDLFGRMYLMQLESGVGVQWKGEVDKELVVKELLCFTNAYLDKLDPYMFQKHNMKEYQTKTHRSYLEKCSVVPPTRPVAQIEDVALLKPIALSVEFHLYRDEHVIVLEGNNLWFCHKICLGEGRDPIVIDSPGNITRRSTQFKFPPSEKTESIAVDGGVSVTLHSHFAEPVEKKVRAKKEPCYFSLRQIQLAKHTPTEVIQLAYCVAMLERSCHSTSSQSPDQPVTSKRFEKVKEFLEEVAQVVPLESVFYAIAYGDKETALTCGRALQATNLTLPPSNTMAVGALKAAERVQTGMTDDEYREMLRKSSSIPFGIPGVPSMVDVSVSFSQHVQAVRGVGPTRPNPNGHTANTFGLRSSTGNRRQTAGIPHGAATAVPSPTQKQRKKASAGTHRTKYADVTRQSTSRQRATSPPQPETIPVVRVPAYVPVHTPSVPLDSELALYLGALAQQILESARSKGSDLPVISKRTIEHFCPFSLRRSTVTDSKLQSPIQALKLARDYLIALVDRSSDPDSTAQDTTLAVNTDMLRIVRDIRDRNLRTCASLLAAFMEQQIRIPMLKTDIDTAKVLSAAQAPVAMGAWAFISMGYEEVIKTMLSSEGSSLLIEIEDYISGILETSAPAATNGKGKKKRKPPSDHNYAAKLAFMVGGTTSRTVTCSTQYISYSLEHQLHKLSDQLNFSKSLSVNKLIEEWDKFFKDNALSLVHQSHRPLIARWLKWALNVYDLREALAKYTCIGVIGLSNAGKSLLVNALFKLQTQVGTTESKRTVVPFLYNMDGKVDNLDVIDFPGVDDKDSIQDLAALLVGLAQIVIFVLDYRSVNSESASEWLKKLAEEDIDIQVLVCLTHADELYKELEKKSEATNEAMITHRLKGELDNAVEKLGHHPSRTVNFYCFNLPDNSDLTFETLREVGVYSPHDVGTWLVQTLEDKLDQQDLAVKLNAFLTEQ